MQSRSKYLHLNPYIYPPPDTSPPPEMHAGARFHTRSPSQSQHHLNKNLSICCRCPASTTRRSRCAPGAASEPSEHAVRRSSHGPWQLVRTSPSCRCTRPAAGRARNGRSRITAGTRRTMHGGAGARAQWYYRCTACHVDDHPTSSALQVVAAAGRMAVGSELIKAIPSNVARGPFVQGWKDK
jgi:hypothetical protein